MSPDSVFVFPGPTRVFFFFSSQEKDEILVEWEGRLEARDSPQLPLGENSVSLSSSTISGEAIWGRQQGANETLYQLTVAWALYSLAATAWA